MLYKLAVTYKMTLMYFLVSLHINNQSTLYKVNSVPVQSLKFIIYRETDGFGVQQLLKYTSNTMSNAMANAMAIVTRALK
jgi:hypothetical protein